MRRDLDIENKMNLHALPLCELRETISKVLADMENRKSPPRLTAEEAGIKGNTNPLAPFPFDEETFYKFIDILHFHKASFSYSGVGRVSKLTGPNNITCTPLLSFHCNLR